MAVYISKGSSSTKKVLHVKHDEQLLEYGYYKRVLDEEAIITAMEDPKKHSYLRDFCQVESTISFTPAKLKVNKRRKAAIDAVATELLDEGEAA